MSCHGFDWHGTTSPLAFGIASGKIREVGFETGADKTLARYALFGIAQTWLFAPATDVSRLGKAVRVYPRRAISGRLNPTHSHVEESRPYKVELGADSGFPAW